MYEYRRNISSQVSFWVIFPDFLLNSLLIRYIFKNFCYSQADSSKIKIKVFI